MLWEGASLRCCLRILLVEAPLRSAWCAMVEHLEGHRKGETDNLPNFRFFIWFCWLGVFGKESPSPFRFIGLEFGFLLCIFSWYLGLGSFLGVMVLSAEDLVHTGPSDNEQGPRRAIAQLSREIPSGRNHEILGAGSHEHFHVDSLEGQCKYRLCGSVRSSW